MFLFNIFVCIVSRGYTIVRKMTIRGFRQVKDVDSSCIHIVYVRT